MKHENRAMLILAARLLSYPDEHMVDAYTELDKSLKADLSMKLQKMSLQMVRPLFAMNLKELQMLYVNTFDYSENTSLYLTSHELGDSRKRGIALIELQQMVKEAGYERIEGELADYIPMLFEFLAVAPENEETKQLYTRLSGAVHRISSHLNKENPYFKLFDVLQGHILTSKESDKVLRLDAERESADLEPLPYPIMYQ